MTNTAQTIFDQAWNAKARAFNKLSAKLLAIPGKYATKHKLIIMVHDLMQAAIDYGRVSRPCETASGLVRGGLNNGQ